MLSLKTIQNLLRLSLIKRSKHLLISRLRSACSWWILIRFKLKRLVKLWLKMGLWIWI